MNSRDVLLNHKSNVIEGKGHKIMQKTLSNKKGFTIIEVLIVIAIAGLILMIVFLAVPALQRNSRNTTIKNDVQNVLGGVAEYRAANNGKTPTAIKTTTSGGVVEYTGGTGSNTTTINVQGSTQVAVAGGAPSTGNINIVLNAKCTGTGVATTTNSRSVAALYVIETSGGTVPQCADS